ncbi:MAG TPA: 6-carboxytetrahydropterin synthase [candidate division Zixibacteria bacterium]|nr:6-carboxytetrahydropterin synthase [candidate division Zixibacteria bacterium]
MPYRICKTLEVENAHMLSKHPDNCKFPHGHSRRIEFVLEADSLDNNEMVCDFKIIKEACIDFVEKFDHAICINTDDPKYQQFKESYNDRVISYENQDPTTEVLAKDIYDRCNKRLVEYRKNDKSRFKLADGVKLVSVRVWETSSSWAEYSE